MKYFISKIILFLIVTFTVIILITVGYFFMLSKRNLEYFDVNSPIVAFGDSHINVSLIEDNSIRNVSFEAETYEENYNRLDDLNIKSDTVLLSFSFYNIDKSSSNLLISEIMVPNRVFKNFVFSGFNYFIKYRKNLPSLSVLLANFQNYLSKNNFKRQGLGQFTARKGSYLNQNYNNKRIKEHFGQSICGDLSYWENNIEYLDKIIYYFKKNDIVVFLINTPLHEMYYQKTPQKVKKKYYNLSSRFESQKNVYFIDYSNLKIMNELFYDQDHLNFKGAKWFTRQVKADIKKGKSIIYTAADSLKLEPFYLN